MVISNQNARTICRRDWILQNSAVESSAFLRSNLLISDVELQLGVNS